MRSQTKLTNINLGSPTWKESALFIEQSRLHSQSNKDDFHQLLENLTAIATEINIEKKPPPKVFISYAHPLQGTRQEDWTKNFIAGLHADLSAARLNVLLDERNSQPGEDPRRFMVENIADADYIILVGTKTLYTKVTTKKSDGSDYYIYFEVIQLIKKYLANLFLPVEELLLQTLASELATEIRCLSEELQLAYQDATSLATHWISLKNKIDQYKEKLLTLGICLTERPTPLIPIIISGTCESALPFLAGQTTILECARNSTGDQSHVSYFQNLLAILLCIYEKYWKIDPTVFHRLSKDKLTAFIHQNTYRVLWAQGLTKKEVERYPSILNPWVHPETELALIDAGCQSARNTEMDYADFTDETQLQLRLNEYIASVSRCEVIGFSSEAHPMYLAPEDIDFKLRIQNEQANAGGITCVAISDILFSEFSFMEQGQLQTLSPANHIQIIGDPGSGKSTLGKAIVDKVNRQQLWSEHFPKGAIWLPVRN